MKLKLKKLILIFFQSKLKKRTNKKNQDNISYF
jgi:hypothetical protein